MSDQYPPPDSLLPLKPAVFHILLVLTENEQHGYRIMREIEHLTGGKLIIGPGTLYRSIKQMLELRLIEESDERPDPELDDERRRYYRLTGYGRRVTRAEAQRLHMLVRVAQRRGLVEGS
jgi:DNA-binding PadR family transcriptional regulator